MKYLKDILYKAGIIEVIGDLSVSVAKIVFDSRQAIPGSLFIAIKGVQADGHHFIGQVIEKGAVAVVCEDFPENIPNHVVFIRVKSSKTALGTIASNFYDNPSSRLRLVGVTGTNGKTTTATFLYQLFSSLGYRCGLLSTIHNIVDEKQVPATLTTPDAISLNELFLEMINKGVTHCFMEVSSHAVAQHRIAGLKFGGAIFTNLTHDHLDYHGTFDEYLKAKKTFFDELPSTAFALSNADDRNGKVMLQNTIATKHFYSIRGMAEFKARVMESSFAGLQLDINGHDAWFRLVGLFNAYNLLAVFGTAVLLGEPAKTAITHLSSLQAVEGRFDYFTSASGVVAIVDYAHTPDALYNVLKTINDIRSGKEQLITVVGAGGNRDKTKRPLMANIVCKQSTLTILTSDNPRDEDPTAIIDDMRTGTPAAMKNKVLAIENRREAIRTACSLAKAGDIILVTGKGHEKYQEIKGVKYPFDDMEILKEMLPISKSYT
ncbi:MAG: UDP-N-acetylmuramoyl-L-alanyl-D-glutamate--2,6-diaminopimelate ligase [Bacteroidales bacterium]|nr:UDP-N-acetylmuramoyl-L-alanyl-D-glutamate--2,6-diaminopimelate ligase [Bacteroidales bacterium]MDZ4204623.1 UDP-N-acetylmuramoyl-L-alanyl-D-glutamate--2,6-diaminopimelate ligase [Bacteroidales bacterium]